MSRILTVKGTDGDREWDGEYPITTSCIRLRLSLQAEMGLSFG